VRDSDIDGDDIIGKPPSKPRIDDLDTLARAVGLKLCLEGYRRTWRLTRRSVVPRRRAAR